MTGPDLKVVRDDDPPDAVTYTLGAVHRCPFADEIDAGQLELTVRGPGHPEVRSLGDWLNRGWRDVRISHEAFVRDVARALADATGSAVHAVGRFTTAGVTVTVEHDDLPRRDG